MAELQLTLAVSEYDHVRDLTQGRVKAEGIELVWLDLGVEEIFWRFGMYREWDVSEMSSANYVAMISRGDDTMTAIPVFPSRVFRLSAFYVRRDSGITTPAGLHGKRVGVPEWLQTAGVYARGFLVHQCGVDLSKIDWYQGGVNLPGREEKIEFLPPPGVKIQKVRDRSLSEMMRRGDLDAIITAHPPDTFEGPDPLAVRLYPDFPAEEQRYFGQTGVFPIMHVVALRRDLVQKYPWVPMNLYKAFEEAKRRSVERAFDIGASRFPLVWHTAAAARTAPLFGDDYWPYGVEPNRTTLAAFLQYCYEQGVAARRLQPEDLFAREVLSPFKL